MLDIRFKTFFFATPSFRARLFNIPFFHAQPKAPQKRSAVQMNTRRVFGKASLLTGIHHLVIAIVASLYHIDLFLFRHTIPLFQQLSQEDDSYTIRSDQHIDYRYSQAIYLSGSLGLNQSCVIRYLKLHL